MAGATVAHRLSAAGLRAIALAIVLASGWTGVCDASGSAPGWAVSSLAQPTVFSTADNAQCEAARGTVCDSYLVTITNSGSSASSGAVVIRDTLPASVSLRSVPEPGEPSVAASDLESKANLECPREEQQTVECVDQATVPPGDVLSIRIEVTVKNQAPPGGANNVEVLGGGARSVGTTNPAAPADAVNGTAAQFGLERFAVEPFNSEGGFSVQAGEHPGLLMTTIDYNTVRALVPPEELKDLPVQEAKTLLIDLPVGLVGDPLAVPQCPEIDLREGGPGCPADTQVGAVLLNSAGSFTDSEAGGFASNIYNMVPERGYPMEFAFVVAESGQVVLYPRFIPTPNGYALSISVPSLPRGQVVPDGFSLMFFGNPPLRVAEERQRAAKRESGHEAPLEASTPSALFTNPSQCTGEPLRATAELDSWVNPRSWVSYETPAYPSGIEGCNLLQYATTLEQTLETSTADTPTGYTVDVKVPQAPSFAPELATPPLREARVTLPAGVALSPTGANGLLPCREKGPEGINISKGWMPTGAQPLDPADPESMVIAPDGLPHIAPGHCPAASRIGSVEITTPILSHALAGHIYLADPRCGNGAPLCDSGVAREGRLVRLYLEAEGGGIIVKLEGDVKLDPATGRLTVEFPESPPLPLSELKLSFDGGPQAILATPQRCGAASAESTAVPWSGEPVSSARSPITTTGCPSPEPFVPGFLAQSLSAKAGAASQLTFTVSRHDREQGLAGFEVTTPAGLVGLISTVTPCPAEQADAGRCPPSSQIGHSLLALGLGSQPVWKTGSVYLTAGYEGAPFGLSIVTPARLGPFDLGEVVARAGINIDPRTNALTIRAAHLPQIIDGIPLRVQVVNVTIDQPGFIVNPTNCANRRITATVTGSLPEGQLGTSVPAWMPFAVSGCRSLSFAPRITAVAHARTSRAHGAYLSISVTSASGSAHLAGLKVDLPAQLPLRLSALQNACRASVYRVNPAACPPDSVVGQGTAITPLLKARLSGPTYLVSHGSAAFPELAVLLQGEGVTLELGGSTGVKHGITSNALRSLPDTPISSFELTLPEGPHAALGANGNLCTSSLQMPAKLTAQNGAVVKHMTRVTVSGCPGHAAKKAGKASRPRRARIH